ncbi:hypothetical protein NFHSH190041_02690 [Shewanella sp. NFH-SH190041]|uniref:STM4015 family protein n=1 Tax=Shewanella sp. NFH-SH190041 TaxID=2950245 RepID=UPI0021C32948|nr:STM4015 family protein [Shewanella sp. NFH-SH190041]BDM62817.1 hypothetical protein NFHSH190041_02690 [Shewanella sp. NFH-SH190041]
MAIRKYISEFYNLPIEQYNPENGVKNENAAIRLSSYQETEELIESLIQDPKIDKIQAIILGMWSEWCSDESDQTYIDFLIANVDKLTNLKALFFGEMTFYDCEISWIQQGDYSRLWAALPNLQHLQIRGADGLSLGTIPQNQLTHLIIESGGLHKAVLSEIAQGLWPQLQHLELWLGCSEYGWNGDISTVTPLLSAALLPKLTTLALKNSEIQPQILAALISSDILPQLTEIDMSMGILGDKEAELILQHKDKFSGKKLNLSENFLSTPMVEKLQACLDVIADEQEYDELDEEDLDDEDCRYVSVAE